PLCPALRVRSPGRTVAGGRRKNSMLFAYEIAFRKDGSDRAMTVSFDLDVAGFEPRFVQAMKDEFLREALLLIVRASLEQAPGTIRSVHRLSPATAQLAAAGMAPEAPDLTDWALREFSDAPEGVPNYG